MLNTPCYIINQDMVDELFNSLVEALKKYWNNYIIGYSIKTNGLPWVLEYMKEKGAYSEVVSDDERAISKALGFQDENIIFNGPVKSRETLYEALKGGSVVNIDSQRELRWVCEFAQNGDLDDRGIGIRVNFDIEAMCPDESACGAEGGRFGFCYENGELARAIEQLKKNNIKISGLHLHNSSKTRGRNIYKAIAEMACKVIEQFSLKPEYIDVGGGFFGGVAGKPDFNDYLSDISSILCRSINQNETKIIVEPGMSIIGASVDYLTSVTDVKQTSYGCFVFTDGSRTHIDPFMKKTGYIYEIIKGENSKGLPFSEQENIVVSGFTCMENDRIMKIAEKVKICENDRILYRKCGAYTMCLSPQFIMLYPPVYVKNADGYTCVRRKNTPKDYLNCHKN